MNKQVITAEAVEAAAKAVYGHGKTSADKQYENCREVIKRNLRDEVAIILEAAAPYIRAQALEDAADKFGEAASWSDSRPSPEQVQRWLRAGATAERGSSGDD